MNIIKNYIKLLLFACFAQSAIAAQPDDFDINRLHGVEDVNLTFVQAACDNRRDIMEYLSTPHESVPLPDQYGMNIAFKEATYRDHLHITALFDITDPNNITFNPPTLW